MHSINSVYMLIPISQLILSLFSTLVSIHIVLYCPCLYFCLQVKFFSGFVITTGFFSAGTLLSLGILPGTSQKPSCQWPLSNWWSPTTNEPRLLSWTPHLFSQLHCMHLPCGSMGLAVAVWSTFNCHPPYDTHTCTHFVFHSLLRSVTRHQKPERLLTPILHPLISLLKLLSASLSPPFSLLVHAFGSQLLHPCFQIWHCFQSDLLKMKFDYVFLLL